MQLHPDRREALTGSGAMALAMLSAPHATAAIFNAKDPVMTADQPAASHDFDFLTGSWKVRHRKLNRRLASADDWSEFTGRTDARRLVHGLGNLDENWLDDPAGPYAALTVRFFDAKTARWSIYWVDSRHAQMEPAVSGGFKDGVGTFFADDSFEGRPIKVRFVWSQITPTSARWEQAFSPDGGASWEVNWVMAFERIAA